MKRDYYLYSTADGIMLGHHMTYAEAKALQDQLNNEYPDEAGISVIGSVSENPALAAERAFTHMANW